MIQKNVSKNPLKGWKMVTPDFEDWLERQDVPIEETTTLEDYQTYLEEELGIHGGSLKVSENIYQEKYNYLPQLGIRAIDYHGSIRGLEFTDTRYGIGGHPGLWGKESMLSLAEEIATERGLGDIAAWFREVRRRGE